MEFQTTERKNELKPYMSAWASQKRNEWKKAW